MIDELGLDLDGVLAEEFDDTLELPPIPPAGKYFAVVTGVKNFSTENGSKGIEFEFTLAGGHYAGRTQKDRLFTHKDGTINPKTEQRRGLYAKRLGLLEAYEENGKKYYRSKPGASIYDTVGTEVVLELVHEEYKNQEGKDSIATRVTFNGIWSADDERVASVQRGDVESALKKATVSKEAQKKRDAVDDI